MDIENDYPDVINYYISLFNYDYKSNQKKLSKLLQWYRVWEAKYDK